MKFNKYIEDYEIGLYFLDDFNKQRIMEENKDSKIRSAVANDDDLDLQTFMEGGYYVNSNKKTG